MLSMDAGRRRLEHIRRDARVSITILDEAAWQTHVSIQGHVVEMRDDDGLVDIDRIARHYTGADYFDRERPRVTAWIEIERWHGWGKVRQP
jgi:hypothetical protein